AALTTITLQISKDELTLAQTLIEIKSTKPNDITTTATITTAITRPTTRGAVVQEPSKVRTTSIPQSLKAKYKGKAIMVEPEKPLKRKEQIAFDEEVARELEAKMQAEMEVEERIANEKHEANIALIAQ
nr:hypothetical protein [Tanacetum cinerariifolium]